VHWSAPVTVETVGDQLGGGIKETVAVTASLWRTERPPGCVHVDTRIGEAGRWHHAMVTTPGQARQVAIELIDAAEVLRDAYSLLVTCIFIRSCARLAGVKRGSRHAG
jgi:hypothetical protein